MAVRKAIVVAVVLGSSLAGFAWAATGESDDEPSGVFRIPVGNIDDDLAYVTYRRNSSDDAWHAHAAWSFRVLGTGRVLDMTGMPRDVLKVATGKFVFVDSEEIAPRLKFQMETSDRIFVDLSTRRGVAINFDYWMSEYLQDRRLQLVLDEGFSTYHGPDFWLPLDTISKRLVLEYQGEALRVGEALNATRVRTLDWEWVLSEPGAALESLVARVDSAGTVDGRAAALVKVTGCASLSLGDEPSRNRAIWESSEEEAPSATVPLLGAYVPLRSRPCFEIETWLSEESPYPVLVVTRVTLDGEVVRETMDAEARRALGAGAPIRWLPYPEHGPDADSDPSIARSPGTATLPVQGAATWPPYSIDAARSSLEQDPRLSSFQSWRASHPDARIVGILYTSHSSSACAPSLSTPYGSELFGWRIIFAAPKGDYFVLYSLQVPHLATPVNCEVIRLQGPRFSSDWIPSGPISLEGAEQRWRGMWGPATPSYLGWGVRWGCPNSMVTGQCAVDNPRTIYPKHLAGAWDDLVLFDSRADPSDPSRNEYHGMGLDARNGNLRLSGSGDSSEVPRTFLGVSQLTQMPRAEAARTGGPGTPDVVVAATVAGGLFGLVALLAFLGPLARYYAGQGLLWIPGFAKIPKDRVLEHRTRQDVHDLVNEEPGISPPEMQARLGLPWTTLIYHLRVLERNKVLSSLIDGRHKRFFPSSADWPSRGKVAALRNVKTRRLYELLQPAAVLSRREIARSLGMNPTAVDWHLRRLTAVGLVASAREGGRVHYFVESSPPYEGRPPQPASRMEIT